MGRGSNLQSTMYSSKLDSKEILIKGRLEGEKEAAQPSMSLVKSSNVEAIGYSPRKKQLHITYKTNNLKKKHGYYSGVPRVEYEALLAADSKGKYIRKNFGGVYDWNYLDPDDIK